MSTCPLVSFSHICARIDGRDIFSGLCLDVNPGEHLAILGRNGSGKSTLLRMMQGDLRAPQDRAGTLYWGFSGQADPSPLEPKEHSRLVSGAMQALYLRKGWRVTGEEVVLSGLLNGILLYGQPDLVKMQQARLLAAAAGAEELMDMTITHMSQGQFRLILLLRALIARPRLLLLDEPFEGLSQAVKEKVAPLLEDAATWATLVITAHREEDIPEFIGKRVFLDPTQSQPIISLGCKGISEVGLLQSPVPASASNALFQHVSLCEALAPYWKASFSQGQVSNRQELISLQAVDVYLDQLQVLHNITWHIRPGEHWAVTGGNGAGKSTLLRLLYGEEFAAVGGSLRYCGMERPPLLDFRRHVGFVADTLQHRYTYDLSAEEVVITGQTGNIGLYHTPRAEERERAREILDFFGLGHTMEQPFHALSSGTARRVLLARAMACCPSMLLLDEPCAGLDPASREQYLDCLGQIAAQGVTLLYVSHYPAEIPSCFTHQLLLQQGRVASSTPR